MNLQTVKIKVLELDLKGCIYLNRYSKTKHIALFFKCISRLGDGLFWMVMLLTVWYIEGLSYAPQLLYLVVGASLGTLLYKTLKKSTIRPRPYQVHQVILLGERPLDHFSFPSGHTLHAVMISSLLGAIQPILLFIMVPFSLMIGLSRMVLGLHYPTDVIVGAALGLTVAAFVLSLASWLKLPL